MELIDPSRFARSPVTQPKPPVINFIVPCCNEEQVLPETAARLATLLDELKAASRIDAPSSVYFIDDGSSDGTWPVIQGLALARVDMCGVKLSSNRGHQNALLCGLMSVPGDALISLDADLQDDLSIIPDMVAAFLGGHQVVYAVRRRRDTDTRFKRTTALAYYRLLRSVGVRLVFNHGDYRLLGRQALEALRGYRETHVFLRGLIPRLGFRSATIEFDRAARFAGASNYPLRRMLSFAWQGITSFSAAPLRLITGLGVAVSVASVGLAMWALFIRLFTDMALPGWASIVIPTYFLGGIQLLSLGVIGEYLAKVYESTKSRPRYHIEDVTGQWQTA